MVRKKMEIGTKIAIGLGVVAAGLGALLYYLSTRVKGAELVSGKTYYFDYIPGTPNLQNFLVTANTPFTCIGDIILSIEGSTETVPTKIGEVRVYKKREGEADLMYTAYFSRTWKGDSLSMPIGPGDGIIIFYTTSFSWTV